MYNYLIINKLCKALKNAMNRRIKKEMRRVGKNSVLKVQVQPYKLKETGLQNQPAKARSLAKNRLYLQQ